MLGKGSIVEYTPIPFPSLEISSWSLDSQQREGGVGLMHVFPQNLYTETLTLQM
jgi:hypothetical protein